MPIIEIQHIPGALKERKKIPHAINLQDFIIENEIYDYDIVINGNPIHPFTDMDFIVQKDESISFYGQPLGGLGGLVGAVFKPITKLLSFLVPKPSLPNQAGQAKESPNNKLTGQTNIARLNQARPDIYGAPVSYPDLINESLFEYRGNERFITEWMNFGIGKYTISRLRYSESPLSSLAGSDYTIYEPGQVIPLINEGFEFPDIDGQSVPGPNESSGSPAYEATTNSILEHEFFGSTGRIRIPRNPIADNFDYFYESLKPLEITFYLKIGRIGPMGAIIYEITKFSATLDSATRNDISDIDFYHEFILSGVSPQLFSGSIISMDYFRMADNSNLVIGPFFAPIPGNQLWVHLRLDIGTGPGLSTGEIRCFAVDDNNSEIAGTTFTTPFTISTEKSESVFRTIKLTPNYGFSRYAFTIKRTNNSNDINNLFLEEAHSVTTRFNVVYPYDTVIRIQTRATKQAVGGRERKFNAIANRHTITYNMATQSVDYTLRPSRSFSDAVIHSWIIVGNQPESTIDAYELYRIASELPDNRLGNFDFTFDDADIALGARIETICNAATVTAYWEDGILSFVRDENQPFPVMLFNGSNTLIDGYKISYDMTLPGGFDGVDLQYVNPQTNKYEHILLSIVGDQIVKQTPRKAQKIELAGCRDKYQAMDRAILECRRLIYSRITQTITALRDGNSVSVGQLVRYSDTLDVNQQDGEIISRNGNEFITSESINFVGDMYVVVTDRLGKPSNKIRAFPIAGNNFGFIADIRNVELNFWDGNETQAPSRYIISTQKEIDSTMWTVTQKKPSNDTSENGKGEVAELTLVEYNPEMYDYQDLLNQFMQ